MKGLDSTQARSCGGRDGMITLLSAPACWVTNSALEHPWGSASVSLLLLVSAPGFWVPSSLPLPFRSALHGDGPPWLHPGCVPHLPVFFLSQWIWRCSFLGFWGAYSFLWLMQAPFASSIHSLSASGLQPGWVHAWASGSDTFGLKSWPLFNLPELH